MKEPSGVYARAATDGDGIEVISWSGNDIRSQRITPRQALELASTLLRVALEADKGMGRER